ncbi:MAG: ABC transporter [Sphingobacteriaceae bacterium]|nr:ABC transporter [Sphingobacteriaceae bacterium]
MKSLSKLHPYFLRHKWKLIAGMVFVVISNVFGILPPQLIRESVDLIVANIEEIRTSNAADASALRLSLSKQLLYFAVMVLVFSLAKGLFMFFMRQTIIVMSRWIEFELKNDLFIKYQQLTAAFYQRNTTGDLMARLSEDVGKVRMYVGPALMYGINLVVLFIIVIAAMLRVNTTLTMYVLLPLPLLSVAIYYVNSIILTRSTAIQQQLGRINTFAQETYSGIRVIKTYGLEKRFRQLFGEEVGEFKRKSLQLAKADALFFPLTLLLIGVSTILTIFVGGLQVAKGEITPGNIAEFVIYVNMLTWPVTSVGWVASIVQQAAASQERINQIMSEMPDFEIDKGIVLNNLTNITYEQLSFTYPGQTTQVLKEVSFEVQSGQTLGIVGKTGSGKSTIAQLLLRLYDPQTGEIGVNGTDLKKLHLGAWRTSVGYVPQDVFLFSDTIFNNIAFGKVGATESEVWQAAHLAALEDTIASFPDGMQTLLGERGVTLSGGQKQRVAIARALLKQPSLYVFDDCLSALDAATEKEVLQNLRLLSQPCTSVIISHRISSVAHAHQILVLEQGSIVERGTHEQLLALQGIYASLHERQLMQVG